MTEKDAIKAQLANAADLLVDVMESAEPMRAEIYAVVAEATDTAIEVFRASLGGEFEEACKNLLGKETVSFVEQFFERMDSIGLPSEFNQSRTTANIPAPASSTQRTEAKKECSLASVLHNVSPMRRYLDHLIK